jgi:hypothetical protein
MPDVTERQTRVRLRRDHDVEVRVRCGTCQRIIGRLYGTPEQPTAFDNGATSGGLHPTARVDWFRRHPPCTQDTPARMDKLVPAYRRAAAHPSKQDRVIVLPFDLQPVPEP